MNEELLTLFSELNPESNQVLQHTFKNSPKMLRLIEFLKTTSSPFKTPKAISVVYEEELENVDYAKLVNRFYKLRQQLLEWLYHYLKKTENYSSKEEERLHFIRYLVNQNQFKDALDKAEKLEAHCQKLNLFELLPNIIHNIIYCKQCIFSGEKEALKKDEERLLEAIDWHQKLQKLQYYYQCSYRTTTITSYKQILKDIKKLIAPYKHLPRFAFIYHYIAFNRGCIITENVEQASNALVRHLNELEKILEQHPQIPLIFATTHQTKVMTFKLWLLKAIFYFQRNNFAKSAGAIIQQERLKISNPNISFPTSEAELRNSIVIYIANEQYLEALQKWDELVAFHKKHEQLDRMDLALAEKANIYFFQFPKGSQEGRKDLLQQLEKYPQGAIFSTFSNVASVWLNLILGNNIDLKKLQKEEAAFNNFGIKIEWIKGLSQAIIDCNKKELQQIINLLQEKIEPKNNDLKVLYYKQLLLVAKHYYGRMR